MRVDTQKPTANRDLAAENGPVPHTLKGHDAAAGNDGADGDAEISRSSCTASEPTGNGVPAAERW